MPWAPVSLASMFEAAELLSAGVDFVRVDLYEIDGQAYFGELTSSPNKGLSPFRPPSLDQVLGGTCNWTTIRELFRWPTNLARETQCAEAP